MKKLEQLSKLEQTIIINNLTYQIGICESLQEVVDVYELNVDNVADIMHTVNHTRAC